eukprot:TRINITY_DN190_c0_g1_i4.p1 TRINITY_DN190_c0_g1~~TRINITY_DN190_c0_g1_i4.p1  ORF type:complete len:423 (-),score=98.98 TRINITY_DN190_c0_g1_i4:264-1532(-)
MIDSFFLLSSTGEVLVEKHWRVITPRTMADTFWKARGKCAQAEDVDPVIGTAKHYLVNIHRFQLWFLAVIQVEVPPLLAIEFLHRIGDVLKDYLGEVREDVVKENFLLLYQLLDEMMDNGMPLTTEPNILKSMILPPTTLGRMAGAITGSGQQCVVQEIADSTMSNVPWRKSGVKYSNNEIYFDIVEEIDSIIDSNGQSVMMEIHGDIMVNARLSGMPDLNLWFNDPSALLDCSFHPCVRYGRWEREKVISFVPPDGDFKLMSYTVDQSMRGFSPPIYVKPQITFSGNGGMVNVTCGEKQMAMIKGKALEDVKVTIPFPKSVSTLNLTCNVGNYLFDDISKVLEWTIGKIPKDKTPLITGSVSFPPDHAEVDENMVVTAEFKLQGTSVSGIAVDSLSLTNEKYKPYKGVRSIIKAGKFQVRT